MRRRRNILLAIVAALHLALLAAILSVTIPATAAHLIADSETERSLARLKLSCGRPRFQRAYGVPV
jgi:hypothetical protein